MVALHFTVDRVGGVRQDASLGLYQPDASAVGVGPQGVDLAVCGQSSPGELVERDGCAVGPAEVVKALRDAGFEVVAAALGEQVDLLPELLTDSRPEELALREVAAPQNLGRVEQMGRADKGAAVVQERIGHQPVRAFLHSPLQLPASAPPDPRAVPAARAASAAPRRRGRAAR